jgi:pSer/pThr/pTyr-binding forkhead associated (FHA) protein
MVRLILRHISGSRAAEIEIVPFGAHQEIVLGRAASAAVRFDPRRDPGVGRYHARITPGDGEAELVLTDLGSRNGTWINRERVSAPVILRSGDIVGLGRSGPEFQVLVSRDDASFGV